MKYFLATGTDHTSDRGCFEFVIIANDLKEAWKIATGEINDRKRRVKVSGVKELYPRNGVIYDTLES